MFLNITHTCTIVHTHNIYYVLQHIQSYTYHNHTSETHTHDSE